MLDFSGFAEYTLCIMKKFCILLFFAFTVSLPALEVFFVPGWRTGDSNRAGCVRIMRDIWPGSSITVKSWDSLVSLNTARQNAAEFVPELLAEILRMPEKKRSHLVLAGHSLGAAIVLEVLCELEKRGVAIHSAALLGAPVANDDPRIFRALNAVRNYCYNVAFSGDGILRTLYPLSESGIPLGTAGWKYFHPRMIESRLEQSFSFYHHFAYRYLEELDRLIDAQCEDDLLKNGHHPFLYDETGIFWKVERDFRSWQLQKHLFNNEYRLIDPRKRIRFSGDRKSAETAWESVITHLSAGGVK